MTQGIIDLLKYTFLCIIIKLYNLIISVSEIEWQNTVFVSNLRILKWISPVVYYKRWKCMFVRKISIF